MSGDRTYPTISAVPDETRGAVAKELAALTYGWTDFELQGRSSDELRELRDQLDTYEALTAGYPADAARLTRALRAVIEQADKEVSDLPDVLDHWRRHAEATDDEKAQEIAYYEKSAAEARQAAEGARAVLAVLAADDNEAPATACLDASDPLHREVAAEVGWSLREHRGMAIEDGDDEEARAVIAIGQRLEALAHGVSAGAVDAATVVGRCAYKVARLLGDGFRADAIDTAYHDAVRGEVDWAEMAAERDSFLALAARCPDEEAARRLREAIDRADALLAPFRKGA